MTGKQFSKLFYFMSHQQIQVLRNGCMSEEKEFFIDKIKEVIEVIDSMPKTYETDGQGDKAIVYLHYFKGGNDWYITEKDMETEQFQAFGRVELHGNYPEKGYVNIAEIVNPVNNVELDLHWTPKPLSEVK